MNKPLKMQNTKETLQLPPISITILEILNIMVQNMEITEDNEFVITAKSINNEVKWQEMHNTISTHGRIGMLKL